MKFVGSERSVAQEKREVEKVKRISGSEPLTPSAFKMPYENINYLESSLISKSTFEDNKRDKWII